MPRNTGQRILVTLDLDVRAATRDLERFKRSAQELGDMFRVGGRGGGRGIGIGGGGGGILGGASFQAALFGNLATAGVVAAIDTVRASYQALSSTIWEAAQFQTTVFGSAGNLSAVIKRPFNEALSITREMNIELSKAASVLPGVSSDYTQAANAIAAPVAFAVKDQLGGQFDGNIFKKDVMELTKNLMVAALGVGGNAGDVSLFTQRFLSTASLPELRLLTLGERSPVLPLVEEVLTEMGKSAEDFKGLSPSQRKAILLEVSKRMTPQAQIDALSGSVEGILESMRASLVDPLTGLFGMLRPFDDMGGATFMDSIQGFLRSIQAMQQAIASVTSFRVDPLKELAKLINWITEVSFFVSNGLKLDENPRQMFGRLGNFINESLGGFFNNLFGNFLESLPSLRQFVNVGKSMGELTTMFVDFLSDSVMSINWGNVGESLGRAIGGISATLGTFIRTPSMWFGLFRLIGKILVATFEFIFGALKGIFLSNVEYIGTLIEDTFSGLIGLLEAINKVASFFSFRNLGNLLAQIGSGIANAFSGLISKLREMLSSIPGLGGIFGKDKDKEPVTVPDDATASVLKNGFVTDSLGTPETPEEKKNARDRALDEFLMGEEIPGLQGNLSIPGNTNGNLQSSNTMYNSINIDGATNPQETASAVAEAISGLFATWEQTEANLA